MPTGTGGGQATTGGSTSTGGTTPGATGGTTPGTTGGASTTGGTTSSPQGGSALGGTTTTGGTTTAAGSPSTGGTTSAGGAETGGTTTAGGGAGADPTGGTTSAGGGGAAAMGGSSTAGGGGASGGEAGGGGGLTPEAIVPDLHGFYWEGTCSGSISVEGHNCPMSGMSSTCPANGINIEKTMPVKGTEGQTYTINIEVRGVIGTRCYTGGMRASTAALNENGNNNWWYVGGTYANPTGWWNTYELKVSPSTGDPSGDVYYFNGSDVMGGNACEREATYLVNYKASFKAKGGGTLTFKIHDQNCKGQQNCGSDPNGSAPCAPRTVDLTGHVAPTPPNFVQPPVNGMYRPQWLLIGVTSITSP